MNDDRRLQPLPDDPAHEQIASMIDIAGEGWILTAAGDHQTAAVEAMRADGTDLQRCVALEWPGRHNHTSDPVTVRLLMSPQDAMALARNLYYTSRWMLIDRDKRHGE